MARKAILETQYTFTPSTNTVIIPHVVPRERLILITNVTTNQVIYNFSDSNLKATSYTVNGNEDTTTVILSYNTTGMSSTDKLQIIVDEYDEKISPSETFMDPVGKMRVSTPQALIDTDFEYGTQPTKWETLTLLNNKPSTFYDASSPITSITGISGAGTRVVTVTLTSTAGITTGTPIFIQDTTDPVAAGWQLTNTVTTNTNFTYVARENVRNGSIFDPSKTYAFIGNFYTGSVIGVGSTAGTAFVSSGTAVTCITTNAHGLSIGDGIYVRNTTATTNPPNGAWIVKTVPTSNTFTFDVLNAPTGTITGVGGTQNLYPRSYSSSIHRPFDGGVSFTTGTPYHGNQLIRQTRRYFRYQSGKGLQFSTGTTFKPTFQIDNVGSSGTTVTVLTKFPHNLGVGASISVSGANQSAYNGTFTVVGITSDLAFTYNALSTPSSSPATGFPISIAPSNWYGSSIRVGMFDDQNGLFFEYDGQTLYAVRRTSTDQLSGGVSVTNNSAIITGSDTKFSSELKPGDYVAIRGMSYIVNSIISDTSMIVSPEYRGTTISTGKVIVTKRVDQKVPQSQWNIDKCDGTGPSAYDLDLSKMQMIYLDYSWYGAGAIRYGFKNQRGEVIYVHRIPNANFRTEAYMRSGNLPARYEVNTIPPITYLTSTLLNTSGIATVASTSGFPPTGTIVIRASGNTGAIVEYANYTGIGSTTFTGLTRAVTNLTGPGGLTGAGGTATAATFTYSATAPVSVELHAPQSSASVGHWGSSVIMDGRFDDDKSFIFTAGTPTSLSVAASATNALISLRPSPSVDSGFTGLLGQRELITRMQLTLREMGVLSGGNFRISLILNGRVSTAGTFAAAGGSSLSQVCFHPTATTVTGGETIYSFFAATGVTSKELPIVRDLGNSIIGGGTTTRAPTTVNNLYPDGPDIVTVVATNVGTAATTINARLSWTEAQA